MLYIVLAYNGTDNEAPARRQRVRATHLEGIRPAVDSGMLQLGGAILDDGGTMVGSVLLLEAESADAARDFVDNDIYRREGVWQRVEIHPFQRAV